MGLGGFAIELDGSLAGRLLSVDAGLASGETVAQTSVSGRIPKHVSRVTVPEAKITCGAGMSRAFYEWVKQSLDANPVRKSAAVISVNEKNELTSRMEFRQALISEVIFPALDVSSKDRAFLTVKFAPETADMNAGSGGKVGVYTTAPGKLWSASSFRLSIDGLENACKRVTSVGPLSTKFKIKEHFVGSGRTPQLNVQASEYSDLVIKIPTTHAQEFFDWHKRFVVEGNQDLEKSGSLEYLDPSAKYAYFRVDFKNLGISNVVMSGGDATITIYCEDMDFAYEAKACLP